METETLNRIEALTVKVKFTRRQARAVHDDLLELETELNRLWLWLETQ